jgi:polar amino acid transport system substrate-binding protein
MQKLTPYIALLALIVAIYATVSRPTDGIAPAKTETVAERVLRTGTIRCGYAVWPPAFISDIQSHDKSGVYHDIIQEAARRMALKIEYVEESPLDQALTGITNGRFDMFCFPLYANGNRAREVMFSSPISYASVFMVVAEKNQDLTGDLAQANDSRYRMAILDGEMTAILADQQFPKAQVHAVPQIQGFSFVLKDIAEGKADFTISDQQTVADFNKNNDKKLKLVGNPAVTNAIAFPLPRDPRFKGMIDTALNEIILDGFVERTIQKYNYQDNIMLPSMPYQARTP